MYCPNCGAEVAAASRFCSGCGEPAPRAAAAMVASSATPSLAAKLDHAVTDDMAAWPWARFLARQIDLTLTTSAIVIVFFLSSPATMFQMADALGNNELIFGMALLPAALVLDAVIMGSLGTTPGKWIAGIVVRPRDGSVTIGRALMRNLGVYVYGLAFGVPLFNLIAMAMGARRLRLGRLTRWDESGGFAVVGRRPSVLHWIGLITLAISLLVASRILGQAIGESRSRLVPATASTSSVQAPKVQTAWVNPETGRALLLPDSWRIEPVSGVVGLTSFIDPTGRYVLLLGHEDFPFDVAPNEHGALLTKYLDALEEANPAWGPPPTRGSAQSARHSLAWRAFVSACIKTAELIPRLSF